MIDGNFEQVKAYQANQFEMAANGVKAAVDNAAAFGAIGVNSVKSLVEQVEDHGKSVLAVKDLAGLAAVQTSFVSAMFAHGMQVAEHLTKLGNEIAVQGDAQIKAGLDQVKSFAAGASQKIDIPGAEGLNTLVAQGQKAFDQVIEQGKQMVTHGAVVREQGIKAGKAASEQVGSTISKGVAATVAAASKATGTAKRV